MAIIPQIASAAEDRASGAQVIDGSLVFDRTRTPKLKRTFPSIGNRKRWTWSGWVKKDEFDDGSDWLAIFMSYPAGTTYAGVKGYHNLADDIGFSDIASGSINSMVSSNRLLRDTGWYHIVCILDTTQSTNTDRVKLWVNGERITSIYSGRVSYLAQNADGLVNSANEHYIGAELYNGGDYASDCTMSQGNFIDGQALEPTEFGFTDSLTGTWRPKKFIPPYKPNSGQSWSGMCAGGTDGGYEHTKAFDGADNTNCYPSPGSTVTMTIPAGKLKYTTSFKAWVSRDINGGVITVNGGSNVTPSGSGFQIVDLSGQVAAGADITQITWARAGSGSIGIAMIYIMIDGVALLDDDYSNFGVNGFYLPMDGNSPIGKDKSRRGNDFTPINFGAYGTSTMNGSEASATVHIDTPGAGGLPILNTVSGGRVSTTGFRTDPYASSLVLAIPGASDIKDYSATIKGSGTNKTVTNNGATTPNTKSHYYGGAIYSDGSDSEFQVGSSTEADFAFAGEFTWEMWWYPISSGATTHARAWYFGTAEDDGGGAMHWYTSGNVNMLGGGAGGATSPLGTTDICTGTVTMDAWNHIAVTRDSANKVRVFLNGVLSGSTTNTNPVSSGQRTFKVGGPQYETAQYWQDIRLYNGACKYKEDFNPGSPYPDVIPDSPSGVAYSSELTKPTSGSVVFDGNGDYLSLDSTSDFDFGTGDFTIELWAYCDTYSGSPYFFDFRTDGSDTGTTNKIVWYVPSSSGKPTFWTNGSSRIVADNIIALDSWVHLALVRSSGTTKMYINGSVQSSTYSDTTDYGDGGSPLIIGQREGTTSQSWPGFISNVRIVNGTALYTSDFTPPTGPLTNITNTKLLCCQGSSAYSFSPAKTGTASFNLPLSSAPFTDSSSNTYTVTNTGSVTTASAGTNNFNITNAASFDGSSQRLNMNSNVTLTGDWTIDAWIKLDSSASGYNAIYNSGYTSSNNTYIYMSVDDDEKPYLEGGSAGGRTTATNAINKNQWYHFRAIQAAGSMHLYVDGEKVVTHGQNTTDMSSLGTDCIGSLVSNGNNANNFHGLIGPVRYVSSALGAPPVGGLPTTAGALSNTPVISMGVGGQAAAVSFNPFDTDIDTVTGKSGQYCRWNALWKNSTQTNGDKVPVLRNGNLNVVFASGESTNTFKSVCGTIAIDSTKGGKWYYETSSAGGIYNQIGMCREDYLWQVNKDGWGIAGSGMGLTFSSGGNWSINKGSLWTNLTTWSTYGQLVSFLIDFDNNTVNAWVDGIEVAYTVDISSYVKDWAPFWYPMISLGYNTGNCTGDETSRSNFGQRPFKFTPPEGYQPICEANMSSPGITNIPDKYFTTFSYNGSSATTFRKLGLEADLVWIKSNYDNVGGWNCLDTVRGASQTVQLNTNAAQTNETGNFVSFDKEGVTVTGSANAWNGSGDKFVIYAWAAGGSKGTFNKDGKAYSTAATAGLTAGDITPTGSSINTKTGFSIIQYTAAGNGDRVPHGLTQTPDFLITKVVSSPSDDWSVYTTVVDGSYDYFVLNGTNAKTDSGQTAFNATTFPNVWGSGKTIINYAWHSVPGVQKFGRFTGTNAADGPFIYLGFQPAVIILKESSGGSAWTIKCNNAFDNVYATTLNHKYTGTTNPVGNQMYLNTTAIDEAKSAAYGKVDFLSNGFKPRVAGQSVNSAATYIYMAWAAEPFHNLYGGQANAR